MSVAPWRVFLDTNNLVKQIQLQFISTIFLRAIAVEVAQGLSDFAIDNMSAIASACSNSRDFLA
ncbi:MAG: hypothetical protein RMY29_011980 [Nostoc sp. CreGUA01]|nr:hypothetical protein [Nostoc sp. CreGUA01]